MADSKLDKRLEIKIRKLTEADLDRSTDPEYQIPIKIVPYKEYKTGIVTEISLGPLQPVQTKEDISFGPGLQALVNELEKQNVNYTPFIQSKIIPIPYVITELNANKIREFQRMDYVFKILDDSPII